MPIDMMIRKVRLHCELSGADTTTLRSIVSRVREMPADTIIHRDGDAIIQCAVMLTSLSQARMDSLIMLRLSKLSTRGRQSTGRSGGRRCWMRPSSGNGSSGLGRCPPGRGDTSFRGWLRCLERITKRAKQRYGPSTFGGLEASAGAGRLIRAELLLEAGSLIDQ